MSLHFEDYLPGARYASRGRTVTECDIVSFAGLSGDFVELHMNEEYARKGPFGQRIAHGALIFSIATGLMIQMGDLHDTVIAFYGVDRLRFVRPVFIGDTIRVTKTVVETKLKAPARGVVTFDTTVLNQKDEPVLVYFDKLLLKTKA